MASVFGKTILGVVAALVASGSAIAQDVNQLFQEGVQALRLNKQEEALQKFAEVLYNKAQTSPDAGSAGPDDVVDAEVVDDDQQSS